MSAILKNLFLLTVPSFLFGLVFLEIVFRTVIPAAEMPVTVYDPEEGILNFDPEGPTDGVFTRGRFAQLRARWHVNNHGWNSHVDYRPPGERSRPLIAVIGDSYVNSFQVDPEENLAAVLDELAPEYDVYRFGISGAPLSHYLQMSRYVQRHFRPDVIVFNVVQNDFHESLRDLVKKRVHAQIESDGDSFVEWVPTTPVRSGLAMKSAIYRYWKVTLRSVPMAQLKWRLRGNGPEYVGNINVVQAENHSEIIARATRFLVQRIHQENRDTKLLFVIDAPRRDLYAGTLDSSRVLWLTELLRDACAESGIPFLDLAPHFAQKFAEDGERFEHEIEYHWNEHGHREAARAIHQKLIMLGWVAAP